MKILLALNIFWLIIAGAPAQATVKLDQPKQAYVLEINGIIGPATADYFERALDKTNQANTELVLLTMDTPGGLDLSMRKIIKKIIASPVPIITYVTPGGSRAASAGTYILYASHIAAMAPATNLGAATPVQIIPSVTPGYDKPSSDDKTENKEPDTALGDFMTKKAVNDAVAYIRSLAKLRGRNEQWAEQAVRTAVSLPAEEALEQNVIDIVATDQFDLFRQLDGRTVKVLGGEKTLNTTNLEVEKLAPDWRNRALEVITNPNIAYILMLVGIYGLIFEFSNPGAILPGTVGSICLLLALFSFQILPINYAGLALILLGIALMTAEAFQPSFGILGLGGIVAFVTGSVILIDTDLPGYGINFGLIAGFAFTTAAFFILALGLVFKTRRNPVVSGMEEMIGAVCEAIEGFDKQGHVRVHSEIWNAHTNIPMKKGQKARVKAIHGLILDVIPETTKEDPL
ncbi:NfeD family protein [Pararhizobium sp.]|uniref:NfeD family protein n=1 Tax=Pararhizobium sp. TaxID=1977563 RepID=UPI0027169868|nr:nodulation protein NfeD [Pararhizobium sp.]MDO9417427.1 nodulation protein NfeD [Pararhizobium sp.]